LAALFDQYRIEEVEYDFVSVAINAGASDADSATGVAAIAVDMDSNTAPASIDEVLQYNNFWFGAVQNMPGSGKYVKIAPYRFKCPKPAVGLADGLGAWNDIATVATTGSLKVAVEVATASARLFCVGINYRVQFRAVR
jgi:hypothetical protein